MFKRFFAVAMLATLFVACNKTQSAIKFNDSLVNIQKSVEGHLQTEETKAGKFFKEGQLDSIYAVGSRLEKLLQSKIDEVESMKVPDLPQAENFKRSFLRPFKLAKEVYTVYKAYGLSSSDEERQQLLQKVQGLVQENQAATNDMQAAQRIFATTNKMKLR